MTERAIKETVARADVLICSALRGGVVVLLTGVLLIALLGVRAWVYTHCDPYLIDYDAPGVDITSEGP